MGKEIRGPSCQFVEPFLYPPKSPLPLATTVAGTTVPTLGRVTALLRRLGGILLPVLPGVLGLVAQESTSERADDAVVHFASGVVAANAAGDGAHEATVAFLAVGVVGVDAAGVLAVLVALLGAGRRGPGFLLCGVVVVALALAAAREGALVDFAGRGWGWMVSLLTG